MNCNIVDDTQDYSGVSILPINGSLSEVTRIIDVYVPCAPLGQMHLKQTSSNTK